MAENINDKRPETQTETKTNQRPQAIQNVINHFATFNLKLNFKKTYKS